MVCKLTVTSNIQQIKSNWDLCALHMAIGRLSSAESASSCVLFTQSVLCEASSWLLLLSLSFSSNSKESKTNSGVHV